MTDKELIVALRKEITETRKAFIAEFEEAERRIRTQVFQEIREAVGREDVVDAGLLEYEGYYALDNKVLRDGMQHSMEAMLDQIERTQKP